MRNKLQMWTSKRNYRKKTLYKLHTEIRKNLEIGIAESLLSENEIETFESLMDTLYDMGCSWRQEHEVLKQKEVYKKSQHKELPKSSKKKLSELDKKPFIPYKPKKEKKGSNSTPYISSITFTADPNLPF